MVGRQPRSPWSDLAGAGRITEAGQGRDQEGAGRHQHAEDPDQATEPVATGVTPDGDQRNQGQGRDQHGGDGQSRPEPGWQGEQAQIGGQGGPGRHHQERAGEPEPVVALGRRSRS